MDSATLGDVENVTRPAVWVKPNDVLKLRKSVKRRLQPRALQPVSLNAINNTAGATVPKRVWSLNPFRCSVQKKPRIEEFHPLLHRATTPAPSSSAVSPQRLTVSRVAVDSYDDEARHSLADGAKVEEPRQVNIQFVLFALEVRCMIIEQRLRFR
ncbi:hypothetical protein V5799_033796 [Amblyomma americanum]|uniref:Uncharacterized protein n=1 Tax=Amblyomma americanum TaxID=6943 RepID=A0AAQ4DMB0_AMBAM